MSNLAALAANAAVCCFTRSDHVLSIAALAAGSRFAGIKLAAPGIGTLGAGTGDADDGADEAAGADPTRGGAGDADGVAAGADPTGGGGGFAVFGPGCSVVDFRRSCFLASCLQK